MAEMIIPVRSELRESIHFRMKQILMDENIGKSKKKYQSDFIAELIEIGLDKKYGKQK